MANIITKYLIPWFMEPEDSKSHSQGSQLIPIMGKINPISHTVIYSFNIYSNIVLRLRLGPPRGLFSVKI